MPFQLSPGVLVVEKDLTSIIPAVSSSVGAFAGTFPWGPVMEPRQITSENELAAIFGKPTDANATSFFTAANFLSYSNNILINRVDTLTHRNAVATPRLTVTSVAVTANGTGYTDGTNALVVTVTFADPEGTSGSAATGTCTVNSSGAITGITITDGGSGYITAPTLAGATFNIVGTPTGTPVPPTGTVTTASEGLKINNKDDYMQYWVNGNAYVGCFAAKYPGALGNSIEVQMADWASYSTWDYKAEFVGAPNTSSYASLINANAKDELHVIVIDKLGFWTGIKGAVIEKFAFLSKASDARRSDGSNQYYKDVINDTSKYVWWMDHPDATPPTVTTSTNTLDTLDDTKEWGTTVLSTGTDQYKAITSFDAADLTELNDTLESVGSSFSAGDLVPGLRYKVLVATGLDTADWTEIADETSLEVGDVFTALAASTGNDAGSFLALGDPIVTTLTKGVDDMAATNGQLQTAWAVFNNPEVYDISLLPCGAVAPEVAKYIVEYVAGDRKDCMAFVSPCTSTGAMITGTDTSAVVAATIAFRNDSTFNVNSSYAALDSGWKYMYDRYSDVYRWIPLNGDTAGLCARTDYTNDPWYSPGGLNRGQYKGVLKTNIIPNRAQRDSLYMAGINPVVTFPGQGATLFGDKTLLSKPSAFDRINVRRLFIVLEKAIATAAKYQLFEFNDSFTRAQFRSMVEPFLRDVQGRRGLYDFRVKCDEGNNTGEVIDRNEFVADIFIKPAKSINFITLNFIAARTSISFDEIGG